jgi:hypothetical protein
MVGGCCAHPLNTTTPARHITAAAMPRQTGFPVPEESTDPAFQNRRRLALRGSILLALIKHALRQLP